MALINKTGITNGGTIEAEHITRAIDALSGGTTDTIIATGSLQGTASYADSSSYALTASYALNGGGGGSDTTINAADTTTGFGPWYPVFVASAGTSQTARIDTSTFTYNATTNNLTITSSFAVSASNAMKSNAAVGLSETAFVPANPSNGTFYMDTNNPDTLWIFNDGNWYYFTASGIGTP